MNQVTTHLHVPSRHLPNDKALKQGTHELFWGINYNFSKISEHSSSLENQNHLQECKVIIYASNESFELFIQVLVVNSVSD